MGILEGAVDSIVVGIEGGACRYGVDGQLLNIQAMVWEWLCCLREETVCAIVKM